MYRWSQCDALTGCAPPSAAEKYGFGTGTAELITSSVWTYQQYVGGASDIDLFLATDNGPGCGNGPAAYGQVCNVVAGAAAMDCQGIAYNFTANTPGTSDCPLMSTDFWSDGDDFGGSDRVASHNLQFSGVMTNNCVRLTQTKMGMRETVSGLWKLEVALLARF
jgi:hypothetical protein